MKSERRSRTQVSEAALDETLRLYGGWLAYLLDRLGEDVVRVPAEDLRQALAHFSCGVQKEGDAYVIYIERAGDRNEGGNADGGQENQEEAGGSSALA